MFCCGGDDDADEENVIGDLDRWTRKVVDIFVPKIVAAEPITDHHLEQPKGTGNQPLTVTRVGWTRFENLERDPSFGRFPRGGWAALTMLHNPLFFPLKDIILDIDDKDLPELLTQTQLDKALPKPNVVFEDPQSDEGMTRQAFYGLGAHRLEAVPDNKENAPTDAVYEVDTLFMQSLSVRKGFEKYGACAYFDADQKVVAIDTPAGLVVPSDGSTWEYAKFAWRSSLFCLVTAVDHLFHHHFWVSAQMLRASTVALSETHVIRRALQPFVMRTALVNNQAGSALLPRESMVHHTTSLTWTSLKAVAAVTYRKGPEWKPLPDLVKSKGSKIQELIANGKLPLFEDGLEVYDCFVAYWDKVVGDTKVTEDAELIQFWSLLKQYTLADDLPATLTRQALVNCLATFSYRVTSGHEHVGSVAEHIQTPIHGAIRHRPKSIRADKQSYVGLSVLMALTSLRTPPLMSDFANYWRTDEERACWKVLQDKLKVVVYNVDKRNESRPFKVVAGNPRVLECAVSV